MNRVWIYQSKRDFYPSEIEYIQQILEPFLSQWQTHGKAMQARVEFYKNRFMMVIADETVTQASGCSMDSLTREIQKIDARLQVGLLDRMLVNVLLEDQQIYAYTLQDFKAKLKSGNIQATAKLYNLSLTNYAEIDTQFEQPLLESWAKIFIH